MQKLFSRTTWNSSIWTRLGQFRDKVGVENSNLILICVRWVWKKYLCNIYFPEQLEIAPFELDWVKSELKIVMWYYCVVDESGFFLTSDYANWILFRTTWNSSIWTRLDWVNFGIKSESRIVMWYKPIPFEDVLTIWVSIFSSVTWWKKRESECAS